MNDHSKGEVRWRERLEHQNRVLKAIRNVNQLITRAQDADTLLQGACQSLTETRGYYSAWIALLDDAGVLTAGYESGLNSHFRDLSAQLRGGNHPHCVREALQRNALVLLDDPATRCPECPLAHGYKKQGAMTMPLKHEGRTFGVLSVSVPAALVHEKEERGLFKELGGDIGYALFSLEQRRKRAHAEERLRLFEHIADSLPQPMSFVDTDYRYRTINRAYEIYFGLSRENIVGHAVADILGAALFAKEVKPRLDRCLKGEDIEYAVEVEFPQMGPRWMEMRYLPYADDTGAITGVVSHGRDITEQKHAEEALAENECRFRHLAEQMPVLVNAITPDARFVFWNSACEKTTGYSREEILDNPEAMGLMYPDPQYREQLARDWKETGGIFQNKETVLRAKDGNEKTVLWTNLSPEGAFSTEATWAIGVDITARKKAIERLRESERLLEATGRMAKVGGWELDARTLEVAWTKETYRIHEVPFDRKPPLEDAVNFFHPGDRPRLESAIRRALERGEPYDMELRFITAKGRELITRTACTPVVENGETVKLQGTFQDVTERKETESALQSIFDMSLALICVADIRTATFLRVNPAFTSILGYEEEELLSRTFMDFLHPEDVAPTQNVIEQKLLADEKAIAFENRYRCKDGNYRWLNWVSHPWPERGVTYAVAVDITARKEAEEQLRLQALVLAQIQDVVTVTDLKGRVTFANDASLRMLGLPREEVVGQHVTAFGENPERGASQHEILEATLRDGAWRGEVVNYATDGREFLLDCRTATVNDAAGKPVALCGISTDIAERKRVEQELRESEARYRTLIEQSGDCLIVHDFNSSIIDVNDFSCETYGYTRAELVQMKVSDLDPDYVEREDSGTFWEGLNLYEPIYFEARQKKKDGTIFPVEVRLSLIQYRDETVVLGFCRDITARKQAEKALREAQEFLETAVAQSSAGIIIADAPDATIRLANSAALGIRGEDSRLLTGIDVSQHAERWRTYRPDGSPYPPEELPLSRAVLRGEVTKNEEVIIRDAEGKDHWVSTNAAPIRDAEDQVAAGIVIFQDITDRKEAEEALRESETHFRNIFANMNTGVAVYEAVDEGNDFVFVDLNAAGEKHSRIRKTDVLGKRVTEIFPAVEDMGLMDCFRQAYGTGEPQYLPLTEYQDERIQEYVENRVFRLPSGRIVALYDDRTEQHRLEERLRQMEKMEAVGQLAGGIAHDFNNQLAAVMGYADLLCQRLEDSRLRRFAENIVVGATRASDLTRQLLAFARKGQYRSVPVNIHETLHEVVAILEHSLDKRIEIKQLLAANPSITTGDPTQLQNMLLNIALNARDAMPQEGELIFETTIADLDANYCRTIPYDIAPGRYLRISVTDTGCGMDAATLTRIFEPFYTTKPPGKGTGMGLAAVYGTVKNHRGAVNVYSEPGHGTTFRVYLPLVEAEVAAETEIETVFAEVCTGTILVVDDEELFRDLARDMLEGAGYTVKTKKNGEAALKYFREHADEVDLVILDMIMPKLNGRDTYLAMKRIDPQVRVLLASGYSLNGEAQTLLEAGVLGFLQKPFRQKEILQKAAEALRGVE